MRTLKLLVEYDGSGFAGWQVQPGARTVQGEIEAGLFRLTGSSIRVVGAGRTDAGVHALGQVVSFRCDLDLPLSAFEKGLNVLTPRDIVIRRAEEAPEGFDARRWAIARTYVYRIYRRERAIGRSSGWYPPYPFSLEPMRRASQWFIGEHDWTSFVRHEPEEGEPVSEVRQIVWEETEEEIRFEITATRFFHHMVRIMIGTLLEVGRGRIPPEAVAEILKAKDRRRAGPTVPAQGLCLVRVDYPA